ncbi:MAG: fibronectin type III domain-containing protein, partial [Acidimicrobiales bacterium]
SVSWFAPTTGLPPTSYRVVASNGATCTTATTSCVVTGLLYGAYYTFTVTASNAAGTSPASLVSNPITPSESTPTAPTNVRGRPGDRSVFVSWTAALNNGSRITLYVVTAIPGGATCTTTGTSCVVTGLTNGLTYTLSVAARNAVGTGPRSALVVVAPRVAAPSAPVGVVVKRMNGALIVSWSPGAVNGAFTINYLVTVSGGGVSRVCVTKSDTCTVTGLVNGVAYHVVVVARGPSGSSATAARGVSAPAGRPSAPVLFHSARGRGVVIVYFHPPTVLNGAPVAYYQYLINGYRLRGRWTVQPIKGRTVIVLRGLRRATAYVVRVRAVSVGGASAASRPVRVVTL